MKDNSLNNSKMFFLESLGKKMLYLYGLLVEVSNMNVSNLQKYFMINYFRSVP